MSTSRLTAGFRRMFGMSVTGFVQDQRLAQALSELREGHSSIAQIAFKVGYSPAYFSTLFRRRFGYQPSTLAVKHRQ
jgi:AraC family transcriptional activator of pyochelin receptor